jgi:hypothetical protein
MTGNFTQFADLVPARVRNAGPAPGNVFSIE